MDAKPEDRQRDQELRALEGEVLGRSECQASMLGADLLPIDIEGGSRRAHQSSDLRAMSQSLSMAQRPNRRRFLLRKRLE